MSEKRYTKEECVALLQKKRDELRDVGDERFPKRSDFSEDEVMAIKAHLGPWPRALETSGVKEARSDGRAKKNKEKRIRAKRRRREALNKKQNIET